VGETNSQNRTSARQTIGLLVGAVLIALGLLLSVFIREAGGPALLGAAVSAAFNLLGGIVLELTGRRDGAVMGSMVLLIGLSFLPLFWVADPETWIRENPLLGGILILIASSIRSRYRSAWPLFAVALLMGAVHILISFF
jgi:hypothetical protein